MSQVKSTAPENENEVVKPVVPEAAPVIAEKKSNLENLLKETPRFDAIKIGLSSPETIRSWSHGEVKSPKPSTIVHSNLKKMVCFARRFLGQLGIGNAPVVSINVSSTRMLSVIDVEWKSPRPRCVVNAWVILSWLVWYPIFGI